MKQTPSFYLIEPYGILAQNPDLFTDEQKKSVLLNGWADDQKNESDGPSREDTIRDD